MDRVQNQSFHPMAHVVEILATSAMLVLAVVVVHKTDGGKFSSRVSILFLTNSLVATLLSTAAKGARVFSRVKPPAKHIQCRPTAVVVVKHTV